MTEQQSDLAAELAVHPRFQLVDIVQRSARFERLINLEEIAKAEGLLAPPLQLGVSRVGGEGETVRAQVRLTGTMPPDEPAPPNLPFTFELVYEVTIKIAEAGSEGGPGEGLGYADALLRIVIPTIVWPFLRAEVAAATSRLGLPPLMLPLVAVHSAVRIEIVGQAPPPGDHGGPKEG